MKRKISPILTILLLLLLALTSPTSLAQSQSPANTDSDNRIQSPDDEDDDGVPRAARITLIQGDVSFLRAGENEWERVVENLPVFAGDHIYSGTKSRVEVQVGRGAYIRLFENTELTVTDLSERIVQFEITVGTANVRVDNLGQAFERFEIDTPGGALLLKEDGLYRINVGSNSASEIIVRRGSAEVTTVDGSFTVREGHKLVSNSTGKDDLAIALDISTDDWDRWSYDRDAAINQVEPSPDFVARYETTYGGLYGVSDLARYGTWTYYDPYGDCWIPRVGADWAPYRDGQWIWAPSVGWTWIANEPWGWAPYHYGRWVFLNGLGWAWVPGFGPRYYHRPSYFSWRPALVFIFNCSTHYGNYVGWYPLHPGAGWGRPDRHHEHRWNSPPRLPAPTVGGNARRPGTDPSRPTNGWTRDPAPIGGGVTVLPVETFSRSGKLSVRPQAPKGDISGEIARNQRPGLPDGMSKKPVIAPLPIDGGPLVTRPAPRPSAEVVRRPVITRNLPPVAAGGAASDSGANRQRTLVNPRQFSPTPAPRNSSDTWTGGERRTSGEEKGPAGNEGSSSRPARESRGERPTRATPSDSTSGSTGNSSRANENRGERRTNGDQGESNGAGDSRTRNHATPRMDSPTRPSLNPGSSSTGDSAGPRPRTSGSEQRSNEHSPPPPVQHNNDSGGGRSNERHSPPPPVQHNNDSGAGRSSEHHSPPPVQHNNDSGGGRSNERHSPPPSPPPQHHDSGGGGKASEPSHKSDPPPASGKKG